jgi:hypothetical protein
MSDEDAQLAAELRRGSVIMARLQMAMDECASLGITTVASLAKRELLTREMLRRLADELPKDWNPQGDLQADVHWLGAYHKQAEELLRELQRQISEAKAGDA